MTNQELQKYLEELENFVLMCDIKGYDLVARDMKTIYPEHYGLLKQAVNRQTSQKIPRLFLPKSLTKV